MANISSPLGSQNFDSPPQRRLVIDDAEQGQLMPSASTMSPSELERMAREARESRRKEDSTISPAIKKRIDILSGLGRGSVDVDVDGVVFSMRTLKSHELQEAIRVISVIENGIDSSFEARNQILARSVYKIDGQDIELILGSADIATKLTMIRELENAVTVYLHDHYLQLSKENSEKFKIFSSDEREVKEAVQDLTKSGKDI